jgi:CheY-like chemotaxis protein
LAESTVRILIVEDYGPFRQFIRSTLPKEVGPQAIFEASDGVQAIELARALRPDLILLDIGLPKLNGIDSRKKNSSACPTIENPLRQPRIFGRSRPRGHQCGRIGLRR